MSGTNTMASGILMPAAQLQKALEDAVPKTFKRKWRTKTWPLGLSLDVDHGEFVLRECSHEFTRVRIPASGCWPGEVQVDGPAFRKIVESYPPTENLELIPMPECLEIRRGRSRFRMPRIDWPPEKAIRTQAIRPDPRHKGPVELPEPERRYQPETTWGFSNRMPLPKHRFPGGVIPPGKGSGGKDPDKS